MLIPVQRSNTYQAPESKEVQFPLDHHLGDLRGEATVGVALGSPACAHRPAIGC